MRKEGETVYLIQGRVRMFLWKIWYVLSGNRYCDRQMTRAHREYEDQVMVERVLTKAMKPMLQELVKEVIFHSCVSVNGGRYV